MYDLDRYNPYPSFQPGQVEAISQMLEMWDDGQKVVELNAPTAAGKSLDLFVLGRVLAKECDVDKVIYTTPLVALVNQLQKNELFNKAMPTLKGKKNYRCLLDNGMMADDCPFDSWYEAKRHCATEVHGYSKDSYDSDEHNGQVPREFKRPCVDCPYQIDRQKFNNSPFGATTFDRYVADPACHTKCRALFVDESASLEGKLVSQATMVLPEKVDTYNLRETLVAWQNELEEELTTVEEAMEALLLKGFSKMSEDYLKLNKRFKTLSNKIAQCSEVISHVDKGHKYIIDKDRQFRLLEGKDLFSELIEDLDFVVLASGTPTSYLYADDYKIITIQHPIEIERRLIHYTPVGSMNYSDRQTTIPKMAREIERLHAKYHKKTMVHCGAYSIARSLYDNLSAAGRKITILQEDKTKRELYKETFLQTVDEKIFMSIDFCEGLDLKGPDYPMNIIAKAPFENTKDEFVAARNKLDNWKRYNTFAAVDVMQASGRCTRSMDDFSETYILDEAFQGLFYRYKKWEPWFKAAVKWERSK